MEHENAYIRKLLIVVLLLTGLTAVKAATSWYFRTVDVKDGLADNFVRDIATDSEGYVWLSTINGVSRYDGYRFLNFQPQHYGGRTGDVAIVRQTADGTLWMRCTSGELFTYRPATQTWQKATELAQLGSGVVVNVITDDNEGGSVVVTLSEAQPSSIQFSIADTGIGVKDKHHIFDRFMQETHGQEQEGSGLGLHIVRHYVEMMGGSITVADNKPCGTIFTVTLKSSPSSSQGGDIQIADTASLSNQAPSSWEGGQTSTILLVEDNTDARLFLQRSLEDEYQVLLAANGKEALSQLAKDEKLRRGERNTGTSVSLIVSDVMMPVMDGIELVRQIRKDIRYSHIPVILLTAKSSEEDIVAGLEEGVADYLTKPFSLAVLRLRIKAILEWTQRVHEHVATGIEIKPSEITVSSLDEELISHAIGEIEAHISDPNYSVVQLSAAVGMTRGTLYKKLMAIVGKSPVEFIRIIRLKRGKDLLDQGRTNISEVADNVGFSPKMFAQHFREMYGETPSDYLKQERTQKYTDYVESND